MIGQSDLERHERNSIRLEQLQAEIRALISRLSRVSVDEEEPYRLPTFGALQGLLAERGEVIERLLAAEAEILKRIGLEGDPELIGSIDVASGEQVGGAEDPI